MFGSDKTEDRGWTQWLGAELVKSDRSEVILKWRVGPRHLQPWGIVHGGVHTTVVETACSLGAQNHMPPGRHVVGVENHTSFVRAVGAGMLVATARPLHTGRTAHLWECSIVDAQDRLVAAGRLRLLCVDDEPASLSTGARGET